MFDVPGFKKTLPQAEPTFTAPKKMMQSESLEPVISKLSSTDALVESMLDKEHKKQAFTDEYKSTISASDIAKASSETDAEMFSDDVEERQHRAQKMAEMGIQEQDGVTQKPAPVFSEEQIKPIENRAFIPEKSILSVKPALPQVIQA